MKCPACNFKGMEKEFIYIGEVKRPADKEGVSIVYELMACPECSTLRLLGNFPIDRGSTNEQSTEKGKEAKEDKT